MRFRLATLLALVLAGEVLLAINLRPRLRASAEAPETFFPTWGWPRGAYGRSCCDAEWWSAPDLLLNAAVALVILAAVAGIFEIPLRVLERRLTAASSTPSGPPSAWGGRTRS